MLKLCSNQTVHWCHKNVTQQLVTQTKNTKKKIKKKCIKCMAIIVLLAFRPTFLMFIEYLFLFDSFLFFLLLSNPFFSKACCFYHYFSFFANIFFTSYPLHAFSNLFTLKLNHILCLTPYEIWNCNWYSNNVLIYDISPTDVILRLNITKKHST